MPTSVSTNYKQQQQQQKHCWLPASILTSSVDPCSFSTVREVVVIGSSVASVLHPLVQVKNSLHVSGIVKQEFWMTYHAGLGGSREEG